MSEYATHVAIARARAGVVAATPGDADVIRAILATVPDPELPVVSIVELGMVHRVTVEADLIDVEGLDISDVDFGFLCACRNCDCGKHEN